MQSNTHIILNVQAPNVAVVVNAKQGDKLSRVITADLVDGDIPFVPPSGVAAAVRYFKPDNTIGFYDVTEDGAAAIVLDGSTATVTLAEQALTVPGNVYAEINFYTSTEKLTTFNFIIHVQKSAVSDQMIESTDYFSVLTERINALLGAATNPPYINETTKNWMIYSESTGEYEDSGFSSIGLIPPSSVTYQAGTSGTTPPTGTWMTSIPEVPQGDYLWTRTQFEFSDGTKQVSYSVARQGIDGTGSVRTVNENSPDTNGNVYVMTVNPNLLDNWYFGNPVNQRGQASYSVLGYTIDRWQSSGATLTVTINDNIELVSGGSGYDSFRQMVPNVEGARGQTMTLSVLAETTNKVGVRVYEGSTSGSQIVHERFSGVNGIVRTSFTVPNNAETLLVMIYPDYETVSGGVCKLKAAKLELGDTQTLAHQDSSGTWVLNEIPDYGEQLARCQRYFIRLATGGGCIGVAHAYSAEGAYALVSIPVTMRVTSPTITFVSMSVGTTAYSDSFAAVTNVSNIKNAGNVVQFFITASGMTAGRLHALSAAFFDVIADL